MWLASFPPHLNQFSKGGLWKAGENKGHQKVCLLTRDDSGLFFALTSVHAALRSRAYDGPVGSSVIFSGTVIEPTMRTLSTCSSTELHLDLGISGTATNASLLSRGT